MVSVVVGAVVLTACGADGDADQQENLAILRALPHVPGARRIEVSTTPYYGDEEGLFDSAEGHTTAITYAAPPGMTQRRLIRFYRSRFEPEWTCDVGLELFCTSGDRSVSINPDNLTTPKSSFDVVANHRGGRD